MRHENPGEEPLWLAVGPKELFRLAMGPLETMIVEHILGLMTQTWNQETWKTPSWKTQGFLVTRN